MNSVTVSGYRCVSVYDCFAIICFKQSQQAKFINYRLPAQPHYAPNFSSAVSSSIHLTNSSSDSENGTSAAATYKMEHDLALYSVSNNNKTKAHNCQTLIDIDNLSPLRTPPPS